MSLFVLQGCVSKGAELFRKEGCIQCHSFKGTGGSGPDLTAVTGRRTDSWIRQQIKNPKKNNHFSRMPAFGHLSEYEVISLIRYLKT